MLENVSMDKVQILKDYAFSGCDSLETISMPAVTEIGGGAFKSDSLLKTVKMPKVQTISGDAFHSCTSLTGVKLPDSLTEIGSEAFCGCKSLTEITVPKKVAEIPFRTFTDCTALEKATVLNPDCTISDLENTMSSKDITTIFGYEGSTAQSYAEKYGYAFGVLSSEPASDPFPDIDGNNEITASDAQAILLVYVVIMLGDEPDFTAEQLAAADVDGNGEITALDAQYTLRYYLYNTILDDPATWDEILHPDGE